MKNLLLVVTYMMFNIYTLEASCHVETLKDYRSNQKPLSSSIISHDEKTFSNVNFVNAMMKSVDESVEQNFDDIEHMMRNGQMSIGTTQYLIVINNNLKNKLQDRHVRLQLLNTVLELKRKKPSNRIIGYTFSYSD